MKWHKLETNLIPNKNRYPKSDTYVLVLLKEKFVRLSYYFCDCNGKWFSSPDDIWDGKYTHWLTHWMKLPELPK